jgi:hypothetical protein
MASSLLTLAEMSQASGVADSKFVAGFVAAPLTPSREARAASCCLLRTQSIGFARGGFCLELARRATLAAVKSVCTRRCRFLIGGWRAADAAPMSVRFPVSGGGT